MTRTCSKGMFNDFFGQWNAHVHSWWNTNNKIRKLTTKCFVSIPILTSFLQQKKKKNKIKKVKVSGVPHKDCPVGGESQLLHKKIITHESIYTCAWISAMLSSSRTLGPFPLKKPRHGKYSTPVIKVVWVQTETVRLEWRDWKKNKQKNCWQCWLLI